MNHNHQVYQDQDTQFHQDQQGKQEISNIVIGTTYYIENRSDCSVPVGPVVDNRIIPCIGNVYRNDSKNLHLNLYQSH